MSEVALIREIEKLKRRAVELERIEPRPIACRVYNSGDFTHNSTGNWLAVTFDTERWDTSGMHEGVTNPSRITFALGGWYMVGGSIRWATNATGSRYLGIRLGGSTFLSIDGRDDISTDVQYMSIATLYYFAATNYVELTALQNSGGNLAITAASAYSPEFWAMRLP